MDFGNLNLPKHIVEKPNNKSNKNLSLKIPNNKISNIHCLSDISKMEKNKTFDEMLKHKLERLLILLNLYWEFFVSISSTENNKSSKKSPRASVNQILSLKAPKESFSSNRKTKTENLKENKSPNKERNKQKDFLKQQSLIQNDLRYFHMIDLIYGIVLIFKFYQ